MFVAAVVIVFGVGLIALGVLCRAVLGLVAEGRYSDDVFLNPITKTPTPLAAVGMVMSPFAIVPLWALNSGQIGWAGVAATLALGATLGVFVYRAAAKRIDQNKAP